jgi:hypothetical protein
MGLKPDVPGELLRARFGNVTEPSCTIIEFIVINFSRFNPLMRKPVLWKKVEIRNRCSDGIQPFHRAAVIVFLFGCLLGRLPLASAAVRGWVIEGGSLAGKHSLSASSRFASSSAFCVLVLAFWAMGISPVRHSTINRK